MDDLTALLPPLRSRREFFDYLEGYSVDTTDESYQRHNTKGLIKTYMLETARDGCPVPPVNEMLDRPGLRADKIEDGLFALTDSTLGGRVALLELLDPRHPVLYTLLHADIGERWVRGLVQSCHWLDRLWLSARLFEELWRHVQSTAHPSRFTRLTFEYEAFFEPTELLLDEQENDAESDQGESEEVTLPTFGLSQGADDVTKVERRSSKFTMVDRIDTIQGSLPSLQKAYSPLYSITQLRIPGVDRGGHDFYYDGRVTNRSDSFLDHRQNVRFVLRTYRAVTEAAEDKLWVAAEKSESRPGGFSLTGAPVYIQFSKPLDPGTFDRWISRTFARKHNRFRITGRVTRLGPGKVQVYGLDRHLWQPILLEITRSHIIAVLPKGTCGNSVHRLVTNIQRFLDPAVDAWLGDEHFDSVVEKALGDQSA